MISRISSNWINFGEILKIFDWLGYFAAIGRDADNMFGFPMIQCNSQDRPKNFEDFESKNFQFWRKLFETLEFSIFSQSLEKSAVANSISKINRIFEQKIANFGRKLFKISKFPILADGW